MADKTMLVNSDAAFGEFMAMAADLYKEHRHVEFSWHTGKQRTLTQNNSLHLFCKMTADFLNNAGLECYIDVPATGKKMAVPWNKDSVKASIWKPIQIAMIGKDSTTDAERADYGKIHEVLSARFAESFGVTLPDWPKKKDDK